MAQNNTDVYVTEMTIIYSKKAVKTLNNMDAQTQARMVFAMNKLPAGDVKLLTNRISTYRLRVGGWRVLFSYADSNTVLIEKIAPRGQVYKEL